MQTCSSSSRSRHRDLVEERATKDKTCRRPTISVGTCELLTKFVTKLKRFGAAFSQKILIVNKAQ